MLKLKLQYFATWCEELTHLKRPWCWERLRAGEEGHDRGWDGWMASLTQWTWVWVNSELVMDREAWRAAVHGVAKSWTWLSDSTELKQTTHKPGSSWPIVFKKFYSSVFLWVMFLCHPDMNVIVWWPIFFFSCLFLFFPPDQCSFCSTNFGSKCRVAELILVRIFILSWWPG